MERSWKAELTDVLGRCIQNQDKNIWIARVLGLMEQELSKAREEVLGEVLSKGRDLSVLHLAPHIPVSDVEEILSKLSSKE